MNWMLILCFIVGAVSYTIGWYARGFYDRAMYAEDTRRLIKAFEGKHG